MSALRPRPCSCPPISGFFFTLFLLALPAIGGVPGDLSLEEIASVPGSSAMRFPPDGSDRIFLTQVAGTITIIENGVVLPTPFLDVSDRVADPFNKGLNSMAFHPDYATNGIFYIDYVTADDKTGDLSSVIARYTVSGNPNVANPASEEIVLEVAQGSVSLIAGDLHFGPDGYLYYGIGNGDTNTDNRSQDLASLPGKILRIDVDTIPTASLNLGIESCGLVANYVIPGDNPFVGSAGTCDAIWAYGFRQPFRLAFDRYTGDLFIGELGEDTMEEIDFQPADSIGGENYGWACMEGTVEQNFGECLPKGGPLVAPILTFDHNPGDCFNGAGGGGAVTGGYRYRGSVIGGLRGSYLYANFCNGDIYVATEDGKGGWTGAVELTAPQVFLGILQEAPDGEIYAGSVFGPIYRLVSPSSIFTDGFESGNTTRWSNANP